MSILLSNLNASTGTNSLLTLNMPKSVKIYNSRVALGYLSCFYSWPNVSSSFYNTTFSYTWHDNVVYQVVMPSGLYSTSDLNAYMQYTMYNNGHYLVDSNGNNVYYISFVNNAVYYGNTITCTPVPLSLPSGYTNPASMVFPTTVAKCPLLTIPKLTTIGSQNYGFGLLIGFGNTTAAVSYPATTQATVYTVNSTSLPVAHPVSNVYVRVNMCDNSAYTVSDNIIKVFASSVQFGQQIIIEPPNLIYYPCYDQQYSSITVQLLDQNYQPLVMLDNSLQVNLIIASR